MIGNKYQILFCGMNDGMTEIWSSFLKEKLEEVFFVDWVFLKNGNWKKLNKFALIIFDWDVQGLFNSNKQKEIERVYSNGAIIGAFAMTFRELNKNDSRFLFEKNINVMKKPIKPSFMVEKINEKLNLGH